MIHHSCCGDAKREHEHEYDEHKAQQLKAHLSYHYELRAHEFKVGVGVKRFHVPGDEIDAKYDSRRQIAIGVGYESEYESYGEQSDRYRVEPVPNAGEK